MNILGLAPKIQQESPIFLLSSAHRTGSTLLQRLLNSSPDVMVWGEQNGYLNHFVPAQRNLKQWSRKNAYSRETFLLEGYNNFTANLLPEEYELKEATLLHLYGMFGIPAHRLGRTTWGFKEVRYGIDVALFLQDCFPKARFIHLIRDISAAFLSMKRWELSKVEEWEREWTLNSLNHWERISKGFLEQGNKIEKLLSVRFEDMTSDPKQFVTQLADFLQMPESAFDRTIFKDKIKTVRRKDPNSDSPPVAITAEDRAFLYTPERLRILSAYGYSVIAESNGTSP